MKPVHVAALALLLLGLAACASVSTSEPYAYRLGDSEFSVSARAERGLTEDPLFIVVNDVDRAHRGPPASGLTPLPARQP